MSTAALTLFYGFDVKTGTLLYLSYKETLETHLMREECVLAGIQLLIVKLDKQVQLSKAALTSVRSWVAGVSHLLVCAAVKLL